MHSGSLEAANTLAWLVAAGADVIVEDRPRNWLEAPAPPPASVFRPVAASLPKAEAHAIGPSGSAAETLAAKATDLAELAAAIDTFAHPLKQANTPQFVTGNVTSGVFVIIDQPQGEGTPASLLLARMLAAIDLNAENCALVHMLPWPTPAARPPRDDELHAFAPFLARALALASPRLLLAFGDKAMGLADRDVDKPARGISAMRGKWLGLGAISVMATFHPRQLMAQPELKKLAWADLQAFQQRVKP